MGRAPRVVRARWSVRAVGVRTFAQGGGVDNGRGKHMFFQKYNEMILYARLELVLPASERQTPPVCGVGV